MIETLYKFEYKYIKLKDHIYYLQCFSYTCNSKEENAVGLQTGIEIWSGLLHFLPVISGAVDLPDWDKNLVWFVTFSPSLSDI
jgi:hypothetical protein